MSIWRFSFRCGGKMVVSTSSTWCARARGGARRRRILTAKYYWRWSRPRSYSGKDPLRPVALRAAEATFQSYVQQSLGTATDSDDTKGFFQWGSMSYAELFDSGWPGTDVYARRTIDLAHWMIDVHKTLERSRNTGYAYEGILSAYRLAKITGDDAAEQKFRLVCQQGLGKLLTWQVGSPVANRYLQETPSVVPYSVGGVMNGADDPWLRIDVTQHQMHAVILARQYLWTGDGS